MNNNINKIIFINFIFYLLNKKWTIILNKILINKDISKFIYNENYIITRKTKLFYSDSLIYSLSYCQSIKLK